jgi:hypothetical protein
MRKVLMALAITCAATSVSGAASAAAIAPVLGSKAAAATVGGAGAETLAAPGFTLVQRRRAGVRCAGVRRGGPRVRRVGVRRGFRAGVNRHPELDPFRH